MLPEPTWSISAMTATGMHMMFNFQVNQNLFYALAAADCRPADQGAGGDAAAVRKPRNGAIFCAITMNSISAG